LSPGHDSTKVWVDEAEEISWEMLQEAGKLMNEQDVPTEGRKVQAVIDGEFREFTMDDIDRMVEKGGIGFHDGFKFHDYRREAMPTDGEDHSYKPPKRRSKHLRARKQRARKQRGRGGR
jgi:hypothetical protein